MATFSVVIPLYNRPKEIDELLATLAAQSYKHFDVVVIEDGSYLRGEQECHRWAQHLQLRYEYTPNQGPAKARNLGVSLCTGEYILFFDSDCLIPPRYMEVANRFITATPNCALWGGPDAAHPSFSPVQKAISYAMTSPFSTGGIRGGSETADKFYPRTFNMGVRRDAFNAIGGFSNMRYGEDVDFSMRIVEAGYHSQLCRELFVFHKRRTSLRQFFTQVQHSGRARVALSRKHKGTLRPVHVLPAIGVVLAAFALTTLWRTFSLAMAMAATLYYLIVLIHATATLKSFRLGWLAMMACCVQLVGYGTGFLKGLVCH